MTMRGMRMIWFVTALLQGCDPGGTKGLPPEVSSLWPMPNPASAGLPNPASLTVDATNDTVMDNVTGLMWQRTCELGTQPFGWTGANE
jgi:hypothetical protein